MELFSRAARYFEAVAREGSVRAAARAINVAASAVNKHILELERDIGVPLFSRTAQGLRLTAEGKILAEHLRHWMQDARRTRELIEDLSSLRSGHVRIGVVEGLLDFLLNGPLPEFRQLYPQVGVDVGVATSTELQRQLVEGDCDIVIAFNPRPNAAFGIRACAPCHVGAIMAPGHPLAEQPLLTLEMLAGLPVGVPSGTPRLSSVIELAEERTGVKLWRASRSTSVATLKRMASEPPFVAIFTDVEIHAEAQAGVLIHRRLTGDPFAPMLLTVLAREDEDPGFATEAFLSLLSTRFLAAFGST
ncbi:LysR family transcriptional regulator [Pseudomonas sp. GX19020]|uniref:LysR family transcriptional regulator n=1 Tax=Pseudomonas sp. GX19020 TaxID=2942277 RepID=UPI002019815D|nr:LysR family transcriptional regulator [Pseudomonas sp. GX19020]MCL4069424.1 LysR family transcriptional regulator [Pseudomonas sp. GX19020]